MRVSLSKVAENTRLDRVIPVFTIGTEVDIHGNYAEIGMEERLVSWLHDLCCMLIWISVLGRRCRT